MAAVNLRAPSGVLDTIEENGVRWISWDSISWSLYQVNQDNQRRDETGDAAGGVTDAQRAQLISDRVTVPTDSGTVPTGTWLSYVEGGVTAYRLILSATGSSIYSLTQPT